MEKHQAIKTLCNDLCRDITVLLRYEDTEIEDKKQEILASGQDTNIVIINDTDTYSHPEILILVMDEKNCVTFGERMISEMIRLVNQRMALITGVFIFDTLDEYLNIKQRYMKFRTR